MLEDGQVCILGFIQQTLFPQGRVSLVAVDERMKPDIKQTLMARGIELMEVPQCADLQNAVSAHPDMQLLHIHDNILISHPHLSFLLQEKLRRRGFALVLGNTGLQAAYPLDIAYNIAIVGKLAFHHIRYTDSAAAETLKHCSIRLVHVNQGYSKCAALPITPESLITSDASIARSASDNGLDVLFLPPQTSIKLEGMSYGFIGGTAGFVDRNLIAFTGNLEALNDAAAVKAFLRKYGVKWLSLGKNEIYDYGGLLPLYE